MHLFPVINHYVFDMFTHIDCVISKHSIKASSPIRQVEGLTCRREGGGLLGLELCVCGCKWHRYGLSL